MSCRQHRAEVPAEAQEGLGARAEPEWAPGAWVGAPGGAAQGCGCSQDSSSQRGAALQTPLLEHGSCCSPRVCAEPSGQSQGTVCVQPRLLACGPAAGRAGAGAARPYTAMGCGMQGPGANPHRHL